LRQLRLRNSTLGSILTFFIPSLITFQTVLASEPPAASPVGFYLTGQLPTLAGPFSPVLSPEVGGTVGVDLILPGLDGRSRLFISGGLQNYSVTETETLRFRTYEALFGLSFRSAPYFWTLTPTFQMGMGATFGSLQITTTGSETQNRAAYFTTLVSPGLSATLFSGLSVGAALPVRMIFSQNRITTLSPTLTLRYEL